MDGLPADKKYDVDALLEKTRSRVEQITKNRVGERAAKTIANALTVRHIVEYIIHIKQQEEDNAQQQEEARQDTPQERRETARLGKQAIIDAALKEEKWRRQPALRRAQRDDRSVTMEDVKKWRIENYNLEKRPRKFNSWVANRAFEEFQADLFFFDDLRQREKAPVDKTKEPVDYVAGLLVVDTFSKKIAVVPIEGKNKEDLGAALDKAFKQMGGKPEMLYTDAEPGLRLNQTQSWLKRQKNVAHNITLRHAPVAERMIGYIKDPDHPCLSRH